MKAKNQLTFNEFVIQVVGIAVCWTMLYNLNWELFELAAVIPGVNLVFLPAMLRVVAALVFGVPGVIGLGLGSLFTMNVEQINQPVANIALVLIINMVGPILAVHAGQKIMQIPLTLSGLNYKHILIFSILTAAVNSALHTFGYWIIEASSSMKSAGLSMFIGDIMGAVIMLYMLSIALRAWERAHRNWL